jgi:hypothetical protein
MVIIIIIIIIIITIFQTRMDKNYGLDDQLVNILKKKIFTNSLVQPAGSMWPFLILLFF